MYDEIKHLKIYELNKERLCSWVEAEIIDLANDFGQNMDENMILHIGKRLRDTLLGSYRHWHVNEVHAIFQNGLSGGYGTFRKVTVQALLHFLKTAQNQTINNKSENTVEPKFDPQFTPVSEFLSWASCEMICLDYVDPEWDPVLEKRVSPLIAKKADDYHCAKRGKYLDSFRRKLKNEAQAAHKEI